MSNEQQNGNGVGGGGGRISVDRKQLKDVILELQAFGQSISAVAERLYEISGDGRGSEFLAIAKVLDSDFIPAAKVLISDLRDRAQRNDRTTP